MIQKKFQRTIEDFECDHCGKRVSGNGYTNHCPFCLWSKHVDLNPGDRQNGCRGLMEPVGAFFKNNQWHILQKCAKCGVEKKIRSAENDRKEVLIELISNSMRN